VRGRKPILPPAEVVALPISQVRIPDYPATLPEGLARECWDSITRELVHKMLWDTDISNAVEAYCVQWARWIHAEKMTDETGGPVIPAGPDSRRLMIPNPWNLTANSAYDRMIKLTSELGLTPVSRMRAPKVKGSRASVLPAAKFLKNL
jgi:P27 family predicted phage terminase small subunit